MPSGSYTEGSSSFDPDDFFASWPTKEPKHPSSSTVFRDFLINAFNLASTDKFVYRANAEVTLRDVQSHLDAQDGRAIEWWYRDADGTNVRFFPHSCRVISLVMSCSNVPMSSPILPTVFACDPFCFSNLTLILQREAPSAADIEAYNQIFLPTSNTPKALTAFSSNAKKGSPRSDIASHLTSLYSPPSITLIPTIPKSKSHINPYLDLWKWSNLALHWCGPDTQTSQIKTSHAILPVFYHHFGCVVPSYEALFLIRHLCQEKPVLDLGSGNGYWTYMLRRIDEKKPLTIIPIDDGTSVWRTMWIGDTLAIDGVKYLTKNGGAKDSVLMLIYPQVGAEFTARVLAAYSKLLSFTPAFVEYVLMPDQRATRSLSLEHRMQTDILHLRMLR